MEKYSRVTYFPQITIASDSNGNPHDVNQTQRRGDQGKNYLNCHIHHVSI